ncbi:MAG TPA: molybdopterin-dependent oxidoreductase [Bryobacteraceae bacterium]|jgi:DMSO/TMAO reductase YedYZ molybdopterin-dependent catalytic subunit|nr:molybdopterin-dependent oxidoreductase [Bryobacteraceae bacterium]
MNKRQREFVLPEKEARELFKKHSRRAFLTAGIATAAAVGGYEWMRSRPQENMAPWPERRVLRVNEAIAKSYLSDGRLAPTYSTSKIGKLKPNGTYGLDDDVDAESWRLQVATGGPALTLTLDDIKALPRVTQIVKLHCIEGWSTVVQWTGARFADFTRKYFPPGQSLPNYVYMETPDSNYYVGLDTKSAMHPQTLLCYERNGNALEDEHGAPLRLVIPVKYGVKSIKRVGLIRYTNTRPPDYWAEQGYDWYIGL